ncbi:MAG: fibronectin type III domain-containing protein [Ruminococcaceae bacterium]|nr:fibronectin type III domain-containing protein [Oscillospiraceae bacterium]
MKKCISLLLVLSILFGAMSCLGVSSAAINSNAKLFDPIALDGTVYPGTIDQTTKTCGYRTDIPEEGYLSITMTYYAPLHLTFEDVWAEEVIDSYYASKQWEQATAENPVSVQYGYSVEPGAQLIRVTSYYAQPGGNFEVSAVFTPYGSNEIEDNNIDESSKAKACPVQIGEKRIGTFAPGDVFDYYEFTLSKDTRIAADFIYYLPLTTLRIMKKNTGGSQGKVYLNKTLTSASFEQPRTQSIGVDLPKGSYYLQVAADNGARGMYTFTLQAKKIIPVPTGFKVITRQTNRQTVSWNALKGVDGYQVQCSDGNITWKYTKTGTKTAASFTGLTPGGKYKFRLRSYVIENGKKQFSDWTKTLSSCAKPAPVTFKALTSPKKGQVKAAWNKATGVVSGYQIQIAKDKNFKQIVINKKVNEKTFSYLTKNLASGKKYYVRLRTYTYFNSYYYGVWSAAKAIKVK